MSKGIWSLGKNCGCSWIIATSIIYLLIGSRLQEKNNSMTREKTHHLHNIYVAILASIFIRLSVFASRFICIFIFLLFMFIMYSVCKVQNFLVHASRKIYMYYVINLRSAKLDVKKKKTPIMWQSFSSFYHLSSNASINCS